MRTLRSRFMAWTAAYAAVLLLSPQTWVAPVGAQAHLGCWGDHECYPQDCWVWCSCSEIWGYWIDCGLEGYGGCGQRWVYYELDDVLGFINPPPGFNCNAPDQCEQVWVTRCWQKG